MDFSFDAHTLPCVMILAGSTSRLPEPDVDAMIASAALPDHHRDPFDRLLVAQALQHGFALVSRDALLATYPVELVWEPLPG
jgi:PIN domain nuclease of toxin-antitoxin system